MSLPNSPRTIAHDLNNVLTGPGLAPVQKPDGEALQVLQELQASCQQGAELVDRLFALFPADK